MAAITARELDRMFSNKNVPGFDDDSISDMAYETATSLLRKTRALAGDFATASRGADSDQARASLKSLQEAYLHVVADVLENL